MAATSQPLVLLLPPLLLLLLLLLLLQVLLHLLLFKGRNQLEVLQECCQVAAVAC